MCEMGYPAPEVEKTLLARLYPVLPEELSRKLVDFAGEVRKLFMGEADSGNLTGSIEAIILCDTSPLPTLPRQMRFQ